MDKMTQPPAAGRIEKGQHRSGYNKKGDYFASFAAALQSMWAGSSYK